SAGFPVAWFENGWGRAEARHVSARRALRYNRTTMLFDAWRSARPAGRVGFRGNPYLFLGPRPFREAHLRGYIIAQHRRGRPLSSILDDPYVRRLGSE